MFARHATGTHPSFECCTGVSVALLIHTFALLHWTKCNPWPNTILPFQHNSSRWFHWNESQVRQRQKENDSVTVEWLKWGLCYSRGMTEEALESWDLPYDAPQTTCSLGSQSRQVWRKWSPCFVITAPQLGTPEANRRDCLLNSPPTKITTHWKIMSHLTFDVLQFIFLPCNFYLYTWKTTWV